MFAAGPVNPTGRPTSKGYLIGAFPRTAASRHECARTADECGRSAARGYAKPDRTALCIALRAYFARAADPVKIAALDRRSTGLILAAEALTMLGPEDYIDPLGAPPLSAMARLRSPSLFYGESSGHDLWPCRMCGLRRLRSLPETGP
jgi:hypothetical protein